MPFAVTPQVLRKFTGARECLPPESEPPGSQLTTSESTCPHSNDRSISYTVTRPRVSSGVSGRTVASSFVLVDTFYHPPASSEKNQAACSFSSMDQLA